MRIYVDRKVTVQTAQLPPNNSAEGSVVESSQFADSSTSVILYADNSAAVKSHLLLLTFHHSHFLGSTLDSTHFSHSPLFGHVFTIF